MSLNSVHCCNIVHSGRVFDLPPGRCSRKVLVFLDECCVCKQARALVKVINNYQVKTVVNRSGIKAIKLYNKLSVINKKNIRYSTQKGSKYNMCWIFADGLKDLWARDFNGTKVFMINNNN